jgi:UPF0755 protein
VVRSLLRTIAAALALVGALFGAGAGAVWWVWRDLDDPGPLKAARTLVLPRAAGVADIARLLEDDGVVRHAWTVRLGVALAGLDARLVAGEYAFPAGVSARAAIAMLADGDTVKHRLTIPEGLTSVEAMALVDGAPALDGAVARPPPDGALMPETYVYSYGDGRAALVAGMEKAMRQAVAAAWAERRPDLPLHTPQQMVVLASLVEKETARPDERARIAGVFLNRLRLGMPLQCDPTVIYALSDGGAKKFDRPLTHADLAVASPYNTYVEKGLPPGPIDNPGWASLVAAARPEATDDLYFVADGDGGHVFARSLDEHNRNVASYHHALAAAAPDPAPPPKPVAAKPHAAVHRRPPHRHIIPVAKQNGEQTP